MSAGVERVCAALFQPDASPAPQAAGPGVRLAAPGRSIVVWPGATRLAIPVRIDSGTNPVCPGVRTLSRSAGGGTPLPAELVRIGIEYAAHMAESDRPALWMGRPGKWTLRPASDPHAPDIGAWVVAVDLSTAPPPLDLIVNGEPVSVRVAGEDAQRGERLLRDAAARVIPARHVAAPAGRTLATMLGPMVDSPLQRWRAEPMLRELVGDEAVTARLTDQPGTVRTRRPGEGVPDALGAQVNARWCVAIATVAQQDEACAAALGARLLGLTDEHAGDTEGLLVPCWPTDEDGLAGLLDDLSDEQTTPATAAARAAAWLRAVGPARRVDASVRPLPLLARVVPPGFGTGVFHADWNMTGWRRASALRGAIPAAARDADSSWATGALIARDSTTGEWCLWIEAHIDPHEPGTAESDSVSVWWGTPDGPSPSLVVTGAGLVRVAGVDASRTPVARESDRWLVRLAVPREAIGSDQRLGLAIARVDPRGIRACWPDACLPWQGRPRQGTLNLEGWPMGGAGTVSVPGSAAPGSTISP